MDEDISADMTIRLISEKSRNHSIFLCSRMAEVLCSACSLLLLRT
jgi:hypothetical protein